jgi:hypothetical protein
MASNRETREVTIIWLCFTNTQDEIGARFLYHNST